MDTFHAGHGDLLDVFPLDAHVGAFDGDGDLTVRGPEARDDLETQNVFHRKHSLPLVERLSLHGEQTLQCFTFSPGCREAQVSLHR